MTSSNTTTLPPILPMHDIHASRPESPLVRTTEFEEKPNNQQG